MKSSNKKSDSAASLPDADIRELTAMLYAALSRFQTLRRTFAGMLNLTPSEFAVLMSLHSLDKGRGIRIRELADRIHVAAANCTATVKALEKKRWVTKAIDPNDSRALSVQLAVRSRGILDDFFRNIHPINQIWFDHVTKSDRATMHRALRYLIEQYPAALQKARTIKRQRKVDRKGRDGHRTEGSIAD
jgi:DNA-binding MarR family transcriptional regulator